MYRIEVASGEETVFRTIEELAIGIRNGVVTPRARIFHHASQKWLPIGLHPHYKKALEMPAASAPRAAVTSTTPIPTPSRGKAHPPSHPHPPSVVHFPEPRSAPAPQRAPEPKIPQPPAPPRIRTPVPSPVIAMQNEVLRDLPVISVPEPLPWTVKPSPSVAPRVQAHAPAVAAPAANAPVVHAPIPHAAATHVPVRHAPLPYTPREAVTPVDEPGEPDADELPLRRLTARRPRQKSGRPLLLLGTAAALVVGTHLALTTIPSASAVPSEPPPSVVGNEEPERVSDRPEQPADEPSPEVTSSDGSQPSEAPRVTIAPARVPMTPGPAFAGSVPTPPGADSAGKAKASLQARAPQQAPASTAGPTPTPVSISPAPAAIELALPGLPPDSIVPTIRTGDTLGMKKILRALNGPPSAAPTAP